MIGHRENMILVGENRSLGIAQIGEPPRLVLTGKIDEASCPQLRAALRVAASRPGLPVDIDMAAVTSCHSVGLRALVQLPTARGAGDGEVRRVILHQIPAAVREALAAHGWDSTPGLILHPRHAAFVCQP